MKHFFSLDQLPANPVNLQMLIDRVDIEQEHQAYETSDCLGQHVLRMKILVRGHVREQKGSKRDGQQQRDDGRRYPQAPFTAFNLSKISSERARSRILKTA